MRLRTWVAVRVVAVGLAAAIGACSGAGGDAREIPPGHIVVVEGGGVAKLVDPEAGAATALGDPDATRLQAVFSPDGRRVAWTEIGSGVTGGRVGLLDGRDDPVIETGLIAFFNQWDPTSTHVASLGAVGADVGLSIAEAGEPAARTVLTGQPLFVSWAPDGDRLAAHVSDALQVIDRDGVVLFDAAASGLHQAPIWLPGGDDVVTVLDRSGGPVVVSVDVTTGDVDPLLEIAGPVSMVLSPDGDRLAILHLGSGGVVAASAPAQAPTTVRGVYVFDLATKTATRAFDGDRVGLFWSPQGDRLLSLGADSDPTWFRWEVHDVTDPAAAELVGRSARMRPSATMVTSYLPFADQYAQTMTPWSPDGERFVFAGFVDGESAGVWIQDATSDGGSTRLTSGEFAAWSPR